MKEYGPIFAPTDHFDDALRVYTFADDFPVEVDLGYAQLVDPIAPTWVPLDQSGNLLDGSFSTYREVGTYLLDREGEAGCVADGAGPGYAEP